MIWQKMHCCLICSGVGWSDMCDEMCERFIRIGIIKSTVVLMTGLRKVEKGKLDDFIGVLGEFKERSSTELQRKWRKEFEQHKY